MAAPVAEAESDATLVAGASSSIRKRLTPETRDGWAFIIPFLIVYLMFLLYPVVQAVIMGFFDWDLLSIDDRTYIGLENYGRMFWGTEMTWSPDRLIGWRLAGLATVPFLWRAHGRGGVPRGWVITGITFVVLLFGGALGVHPGAGGRWYDSQFWGSFGNTLLFVVMSTPVIVGLGLGIALALNREGRFVGLLRTLFFAPYVLSVAVLTLIWAFLLSPELGLIGVAFESVGLQPINWLNSTTYAMPAIVITTAWWTVGFNVVLFLAGLQDIEPNQYEAAELDGAGPWAKFRYITVPGLKRTTLLVVILQVIASFQIFGQVFIMTRGGPNGATRVAIQHIFESGFRDFELGYASAMSVFLFVVMVAVSVVQFRFMQED